MKKHKPKAGSKMKFWFDGGLADGRAVVLGVRKYTGAYPEMFKWLVTVTASRTSRGELTLAL